jgi:ABC-type branched-subunit amino acid transport system substrate-binding protein
MTRIKMKSLFKSLFTQDQLHTLLAKGRLGERYRRLALGLLCCTALQAAAAEVIVGQVAPLSGVLAETGKDMVLGAKIYFDHVNATGGINGNKIKHLVRDDGYVVEKTIEYTTELLDKEKAHVLFGFAGTGNVGKLLSEGIFAKANVALVAPYTGGTALREPYNPHIFHIRASYLDETKAMVDYFVKNGITRIAVFYQGDAFGESGLAGVEKALAAHKLSVVAKGSYPKNTTEVTPAVKTLLAADPQAICMISVNKSTAAFVKEYKASGKQPFMFNISVVNPKDMSAQVGADIMRGVGITQVVPYPFYASTKITTEYLDLLKKYGGKDAVPSYTSFEEFIGAKVLVEGIKRAKGLQREKIMEGLASLDKFDVGGFTVSFGPNKRVGSSFVDISVIGKNGQLIR